MNFGLKFESPWSQNKPTFAGKKHVKVDPCCDRGSRAHSSGSWPIGGLRPSGAGESSWSTTSQCFRNKTYQKTHEETTISGGNRNHHNFSEVVLCSFQLLTDPSVSKSLAATVAHSQLFPSFSDRSLRQKPETRSSWRLGLQFCVNYGCAATKMRREKQPEIAQVQHYEVPNFPHPSRPSSITNHPFRSPFLIHHVHHPSWAGNIATIWRMAQLLSSWNWCEKIWRPEKWILNDIDIKFSMNGRNKNMWVLSCQLFELEAYKLLKIELHNIYNIYIHTYRVHYHQHGVIGGNGVAGVWSPGCGWTPQFHAILMGKNGDKPINRLRNQWIWGYCRYPIFKQTHMLNAQSFESWCWSSYRQW